MGTFEVRYQDLDQLGQLFTRQQGHMTKIQTYVGSHCVASGAFDGPVLGLLSGHYSRAYDAGHTGFGNGATIAETCSTKIGATKTSLVEGERTQVEAYNKKAAKLGYEPQKFAEPGRVPLGHAETEANPVGDAEPGAYERVMSVNDVATTAVDYGTKAATTVGDPLGLTAGNQPTRWGDYIDVNHWVGVARDQVTDRTVHSTRGTTLPDGTYIPPSELNDARQRHLVQDYDRRVGQGQETVYRHVDPDTRHEHPYSPGSIWDEDTGRRVHRTATDATNVVALPGQLVSSGKGVADAGQSLADATDLHHDVTSAANGPSNDGSITWAKNGDGW